MRQTKSIVLCIATMLASNPTLVGARNLIDSPVLSNQVASGELPPIGQRLPKNPMVASLDGTSKSTGRHGGELRMLMSRSKDVRMAVVYGYARLVGYNHEFEIVPDILERVDIEAGRIFTLHIRKGHRWSDGHPFTAEDFRYHWEDITNNSDLTPFGVSKELLVNGEPPRFEVIDSLTVRYSWKEPNPFFLPALAGTRPLFIYCPSHYLKQFHVRYADQTELAKKIHAASQHDWSALHARMDAPYKNNNPDYPTLQPWINTTPAPSERFVFVRNPYYYRIDSQGQQLPYIDRVVMHIADGKLIAAKTGAGESDLQARYLKFSDYTFLKKSAKRTNSEVRLWQTTKGAHMALFPNLNVNDTVWRKLFRDVRFRRALSLAIDRHEINQVLYYGLAIEGNNTVHASGPLYRPEYRTSWARFDLATANALLDEMGLTKRDKRGIRLLPDGRSMVIVVETAGEDTEQTDVLELIHDSWLKVGIKLFSKPIQREVFRNRVFTGQSLMSVWGGLENALPTADASPQELAPTSQQQLQWPKWGQFYDTGGVAGEPVDLPAAKQLLRLNAAWIKASDFHTREDIWRQMLEVHAEEVFSIGLVAGVPQPVVVSRQLHNVPETGVYNWEPGAYFGIYKPDTFWFADAQMEAKN